MSTTWCRSSRTPKWASSCSLWAQVQQNSCSDTGRRWPARGALAALLWVLATAGYAQREPTTQTSIGIFYRPEAPRTDNLWRDGDRGERLSLQGQVLDRQGRPVTNAQIELWHADALGSVDETRYRATRHSGADGRFGIKTVLPGHIERARYNPVFAPRHIHIVVTHPAHPRLVSLIFFKGDERLGATPYPELTTALEHIRVNSAEVLYAHVEIVLGASSMIRDGYGDLD